MPKPPKIPGDEVTKALEARLMRYDRSPFMGMLADAATVAPSKTAWRKLARRDPEKYVRAVSTLAKTAGFADKTESVKITGTLDELVNILVARHGPEKTMTVLQSMGLPTTLVSASSAHAEHEISHTTIDGQAETVAAPQTLSEAPQDT